jgi:hypothetical protein
MGLSDLAWRVLLVCVLPLCACERAAPDDASKAASPDTGVQSSRDRPEAPSPDTIPYELPGDTVTTLVEETSATEPRLEPVGTGYVLRMPTRMHAALQTMAPGFKSFRRGDYGLEVRHFMRIMERATPLFAVIGDFDGDGRKDAVVHGATDSAIVLVAVLNKRSGARTVEIGDARGDLPARALWRYLVHHPPGTIESPMEARPLQLKNDAFGLISFEKGGVLYYYRDGRFVRYTTGD